MKTGADQRRMVLQRTGGQRVGIRMSTKTSREARECLVVRVEAHETVIPNTDQGEIFENR